MGRRGPRIFKGTRYLILAAQDHKFSSAACLASDV